MKFRLALGAAVLAATAGLAEAKTLRINCFWPARHFACAEVLPHWAEEVARVTDGRVTAVIAPRSLAPPPAQLAAVEQGLVDVAVQFNGLIQDRVTGPLVAMLPFNATRNAAAMSRALWAANRAFFPDELDGVQLLTQFVISPAELYSQTDMPVTSIEDLAARRMWVLPGPLAAVAASLGVDMVSTPAVMSPPIIASGAVDGHLGLDPQAVKAFGLLPRTRSITRFHQAIYAASFSVVMNKAAWTALSARDQAAIMGVSGDVLGMAFGARWDAAARAAEAAYAEAGVDVVLADAAFELAMRKASAFVAERWLQDADAAGIDGAAALDFYRARMSAPAR